MSFGNKGRFGCYGNRVRNVKKVLFLRFRYIELVNYWVRFDIIMFGINWFSIK